MKTKAWMRSPFFREENTNIAETRSVGGKKGRNAGPSILFSLVFIFLQTVAKPPTWASMASLHRPTSGLHCRSKRKKERRRTLFIWFFLGGVLRLSTKSQSDKWWSRRAENKNKNKKDTNKPTNNSQKQNPANNSGNRIGAAKNMAEYMGWRTPNRKYKKLTARRL